MSFKDDLESKKAFYDKLHALDEPDGDERDAAVVASMAILKNSQESPNPVKPSRVRAKARLADETSSSPVLELPNPRNVPRAYQKRHTINGQAKLIEQASNDNPAPSTAPPLSKPVVPLPNKLFHGLVFYFFPANDIAPPRRLRIAKAIEYGATWSRELTSEITHIIVDGQITYGQVMESLKLDKPPKNVALVKENFPADCIMYRAVRDPNLKQYEVKDYIPAHSNQAPITLLNPSSAQSDTSLQLKPAGKAVTVREPQTPSAAESCSAEEPSLPTNDSPSSSRDPQAKQVAPLQAQQHSELDDAINEVKHLQYILVDEEEEEEQKEKDGPNSDENSSSEIEAEPPTKKIKQGESEWQEKFQCMHEHTGKNEDNPNAQTIALLQQMADYYTQIRDPWRPLAYRRAIAELRNHPTKITTKEEAIKLRCVGKRLADKIEEIVFTNHLRRLEHAKQEPTDKTLQVFLKIYGVGFAQASRWVEQGHRTLADLTFKASLNANQKIGLTHYDEFNTRIPRAEVAQHAALVRRVALSLIPDLEIYLMGSYRRGEKTCGDIDLLITHPLFSLRKIGDFVLETLVPLLFKQGFLKATLAASAGGDGSKWHGASCLPDATIWRRIDFLLVPRQELGAALIYFTGNDVFNRSLRLLASRKGMRLNQRGLYKNVMRGPGRKKVTEGELVEGADEQKIFDALKVPWREPKYRRP